MEKESGKGSILNSYRVIDLTDEKGMFSTRLLADMGAVVIRVEKPNETPDIPTDAQFCYWNAGKKRVSLDLEDGVGREIFKRLVKTADILVESQPPGRLEGLGLGYAELSRANPQLIMASITDFGQDGPYRDYKSCDLVTSALSGQMYVCGEPETSPLKPFGNQAYSSACLFGAIGVMLALRGRYETGKGQYIDISAMECAAATLDHVLVRHFYEGVVAERQGSRHWNDAFRIFPCRDGYVLLSLFQQWETLVEWLDAEDMAEDLTDKRWLDREERLKHPDHINTILEKWTRSKKAAELVEKGQLMRFPWAEVTSIPDLLQSPQLTERNFFSEIVCADTGMKSKCPGAPCQLSRSPWRAGGRVPGVGEHNLDIFHGELGLPVAEIENLKGQGIV